jgi:hypothetical protein
MKLRLLITLFILSLALTSHTGLAETLQYHHFKFFIHPDLVQGLSDAEVKVRLSRYIEDLNSIFAKQTIRRFTFDPNQDIIYTTGIPYSGNYFGKLPNSGFEIWAHVQLTDNPDYGSYGGFSSIDQSGAGVAAGLYWDAIHDRETLVNAAPGSWDLSQYWHQLHNMTHEIEHIFGAGIGEYYNLRQLNDTTGVGSPVNINFNNNPGADPYWSSHQDFWTDPLMIWTPALSWQELMDQVFFADLTAAVVNGRHRNDPSGAHSLPDLRQTAVWIQDTASGQPLANATVIAWKVQAFSPYNLTQIFNGKTDGAGGVEFAWSGGFNNYDSMMIIKVIPANGASVFTKWFSIYDAHEQSLLDDKNTVDISIPVKGPKGLPANHPPTLTSVQVLDGATKDKTFRISYEKLLAASNAQDLDSNTIIFRLGSLSSGKLKKDGYRAVPGTTLRPGQTWIWTPPSGAAGSHLDAFTVTAFDGDASSLTPVQVQVKVLP